MAPLGAILFRVASVLCLGAVLSVASELWFWKVALNEIPILVVVYGLIGHLMLCLMRAGPVRGVAGAFVAAGLFGFAIEGVVVQQLYLAFPFQIVWTPLAWHALLSVGVALFGWRRAMAAGWWQGAAVNLAMGVFVGVWGLYLWHAVDPDDGDQYFDWTLGDGFYLQLWISAALFGAAQAGLSLMRHRLAAPAPRAEIAVLLALALATWAAGSLLLAWPLSLVFPLLLALGLAALWRDARGPATGWFATEVGRQIPLLRWPLLLILPFTATAVFQAMSEARIAFEANVVALVVAVPLSLALWLWALWRCFRTPRAA